MRGLNPLIPICHERMRSSARAKCQVFPHDHALDLVRSRHSRTRITSVIGSSVIRSHEICRALKQFSPAAWSCFGSASCLVTASPTACPASRCVLSISAWLFLSLLYRLVLSVASGAVLLRSLCTFSPAISGHPSDSQLRRDEAVDTDGRELAHSRGGRGRIPQSTPDFEGAYGRQMGEREGGLEEHHRL